jgi:DNA-binding beta-propeller fold protein YncE
MMTMQRLLLVAATAAAAVVAFAATGGPAASGEAPFEVWAIDQSNTTPTGGGTLYVYDGPSLSGQAVASPELVDLGQGVEAFCFGATGTVPTRPHMLMFSPGETHAILAYVASGHVLFMNAATRTPVACIDVGAQAHAAFPSMDGRYVVVANQNGKLLQRIWTNWQTNTFTLDPVALDLGALQDTQRPDNAPICPIVTDDSQFTFVTLRGGGLYVVRTGTDAPMAIVAAHGKDDVNPNGCGGVQVGDAMYVNSGGGTPANPLEADLYKFVFDGTTWGGPALVFSHDARGFVDSHGTTLTKHGRYLWVDDRAANRIVIVDTRTDTVVNELELAGTLSSDPAPDLMAISPDGNRVFFTMRGPNPLTANVAGVGNAVGSTPGLGVIRVVEAGRDGVFHSAQTITHVVGGVERADPHGIGVRRK